MTKFRLVLVLLCLGILGAMPFVTSLSKPESAAPEAAPRETAVQRQAAAQTGAPVRAEIGAPLNRARTLAAAGAYQQAMAVVDALASVPNKTDHELSVIGQMRTYLTVKANKL